MKKDTVSRYCRRVGRYLCCTKAHKQALIAGLREELLDRELTPDLSMKELCAAAGTPRAAALQLEEALDSEEVLETQSRNKRRRMRLVIGALIVLFAAALGYVLYLLYQISYGPIYRKDTVNAIVCTLYKGSRAAPFR